MPIKPKTSSKKRPAKKAIKTSAKKKAAATKPQTLKTISPHAITPCGPCNWTQAATDIIWVGQQEGSGGRMRGILRSVSGPISVPTFNHVSMLFYGDFCMRQDHDTNAVINFVQCWYNSPMKLFNMAKGDLGIPGPITVTSFKDPCP